MAQSSAERREATNPASTPITITYLNGTYTTHPKNATIDNDGSVTFNASHLCWIYTSPIGVFGDAQGILKLVQGHNGPFDPGQTDVTVDYCITDPNTTCQPAPAGRVRNGGNTIKVGS